MIRHLRIVCPIGILCLAVLIVCVFALDSNAASAETQEQTTVTYVADSWSASGMAVPATAQETAAAQKEEQDQSADDTYSDPTKVPEQEHCDSGYELTDDERSLVECAVMCEAGGEGEKGQMMVAQCILDASVWNESSVSETIDEYQIVARSNTEVTDEVKNSVKRVFDNGERVTEEKADLWYNPAITPSEFHESQEYIITVGSHRFFWMDKS